MTEHRTAERRRTPRRREGAILIEAVIANAMILILLASAWFAHAVYAHKIERLYAARTDAWGGTHPDCENDGLGSPEPVVVHAPPQFGELAVEVGVETRFSCNERPSEHDDLLAALEWAVGAGQAGWDSLLDLVDALRGDE